ncbi:MAG: nascent polypeptide-associated complex protein [Candidatus Hodarchaeota archaeon]
MTRSRASKARRRSKREDMAKLMQNLQQKEINASKVVIHLSDQPGQGLVIENPQVIQMDIQGTTTYQILGEAKTVSLESFSEETEIEQISIAEEDVALVAAQAGVPPEVAREALIQAEGEPARAILFLKTNR